MYWSCLPNWQNKTRIRVGLCLTFLATLLIVLGLATTSWKKISATGAASGERTFGLWQVCSDFTTQAPACSFSECSALADDCSAHIFLDPSSSCRLINDNAKDITNGKCATLNAARGMAVLAALLSVFALALQSAYLCGCSGNGCSLGNAGAFVTGIITISLWDASFESSSHYGWSSALFVVGFVISLFAGLFISRTKDLRHADDNSDQYDHKTFAIGYAV